MGDRLAGERGVRQGEHRLQSGTTTPTPTLEPTPTPEPTPTVPVPTPAIEVESQSGESDPEPAPTNTPEPDVLGASVLAHTGPASEGAAYTGLALIATGVATMGLARRRHRRRQG